MKSEANSRYLPFDFLRTFCVVYIVCVWHLNEYLSTQYTFSNITLPFLHKITEIILGAFTFLSGYFLKRYSFISIEDVKIFYYRRIKRFYLLLLVSALSYLALRWITIGQFLQVMTGTNLLFGDAVGTLWYFSMIIFFYIITPVFSFYKDTHKWFLPISSLLIFILLYFSVQFSRADYRLLLYFPCYISGFITRRMGSNYKTNVFLMLFLTICYFMLYTMCSAENVWFSVILVQCGMWIIILLSIIVYSEKMDKIVSFLAASSMVAYLFHRQVFSLGRSLCEICLDIKYIPLVVAIFLSSITFIISYYIQKMYNYIIDKIWLTKKEFV